MDAPSSPPSARASRLPLPRSPAPSQPPVSAPPPPPSLSSSSSKSRKKRVTEAEDIAILEAIATLQPHRAPWGTIKKTWLHVEDAVAKALGADCGVSAELCQRRYDKLLDRFAVHRDHWPQNAELRALLVAAAHERQEREDTAAKKVSATPKNQELTLDQYLSATKAAIRPKRPSISSSITTPVPKAESVGESGESVEDGETHVGVVSLSPVKRGIKRPRGEQESHVVYTAASASASPTGRRSFVESTLVAVLDRLAGIEQTWLENVREERAWKRQQREWEEKKAVAAKPDDEAMANAQDETDDETKEESKPIADEKTHKEINREQQTENGKQHASNAHEMTQNGEEKAKNGEVNTHTELDAEEKSREAGANARTGPDPALGSTDPRCETKKNERVPVAADQAHGLANKAVAGPPSSDYQELKQCIAALTTRLTESTDQQLQLNVQVGSLAGTLEDVRQEKETLKQDVAMLQALLRDAASLAGTLKMLRDAHQTHEEAFASFVAEQDARLESLERELTVNLPLPPALEMISTLERERNVSEAEHQERLGELEERMTALQEPIASLQASIHMLQHQDAVGEPTHAPTETL